MATALGPWPSTGGWAEHPGDSRQGSPWPQHWGLGEALVAARMLRAPDRYLHFRLWGAAGDCAPTLDKVRSCGDPPGVPRSHLANGT